MSSESSGQKKVDVEVEALAKEAEALKQKLDEERQKLNDVTRKFMRSQSYITALSVFVISFIVIIAFWYLCAVELSFGVYWRAKSIAKTGTSRPADKST